MEQNNEMSAQQSLQIITETFNKSRKGILLESDRKAAVELPVVRHAGHRLSPCRADGQV